jgi:nitrite reductase (NADH) large subunit
LGVQPLVDAYHCEWKRVVDDPQQRKRFRQFVNTDETEPVIEFVHQREQTRPADWVPEVVSLEQIGLPNGKSLADYRAERADKTRWIQVGSVDDFPHDGGATIQYGKVQIAVFNFASRGEWYACQQMCPHKKAFVLC